MARKFWAKVQKGPGCWQWTGAAWPDGRGAFCIGGRNERAYRVAWALTNGPIPAGLCVCHKCDVPSCVRPSHLFLGTRSENQLDCVSKGRHTVGSRHGMAKLSEPQVIEIVRRLHAGEAHRGIAADYDVSRSTVSLIATGRSWAHVGRSS